MFLYSFAALLSLVAFNLVYPLIDPQALDGSDLLAVFRFKAHFCKGIINFIAYFPAIFMSALIIPFTFKPSNKNNGKRFSVSFFDLMKKPHSLCIAGTIIYGIFSLVAMPLLENYYNTIQAQSKLYGEAEAKAYRYAEEGQWYTAAHFMKICDIIWKEDTRLDSLRLDITDGIETLRYGREKKDDTGAEQTGRGAEQRPPLDAAEALDFAGKAFAEERYYDANWFATVASKLAAPGSIEQTRAVRAAALAWNAIAEIEPTRAQARQYALYARKKDGYEALTGGEVIKAYYIFSALMEDAPNDPDVQTYFALSRQGLASVAFFFDEADLITNSTQDDTLFSLANDDFGVGGRIIIRIDSLAYFENCTFAHGMEAIALDARKQPLWTLSAALVKIIPTGGESDPGTAFLMHPVDRTNENKGEYPRWTGYQGAIPRDTMLFLKLPYEDFLLATAAAAAAKNSTQGFFPGDLWAAASRLKPLGFIPQVFYAEIIRYFYLPALFLPLSLFALIIGWKYRPRRAVPYALVPMFFILPVIFESLILLIAHIFNLISIWTVISAGWTAACASGICSAVLLFILSIFLLAAQRGE